MMRERGHEQGLFSLEEAPTGLCPWSRSFAYAWPASSLQRRRDFHGFHPPLARALEEAVREFRPQVVQVQNLAAFRTTVFRTLGRLAVPVLMTVHDYSLGDPNPHGLDRSGPLGLARRLLDRWGLIRARREVFRAVDRFLCPTEALRRGLGLPPERSVLLRLPLEPAPAAPFEDPGGPLRLFFAGTLYRSKGVDVLLEALARTRGPAGGALLRIAGSGDQEEALRARAQELGLGERVCFLGFQDAAAMDRQYAWAHLQVLPSRVPENSPLTVLEAAARGRPALAPHAGGVPELLEPPQRGWTFPPEDPRALASALEEAAADREEIQRRGARARDWVRREFDPHRHWDALEAHWRELAAGGAAR